MAEQRVGRAGGSGAGLADAEMTTRQYIGADQVGTSGHLQGCCQLATAELAGKACRRQLVPIYHRRQGQPVANADHKACAEPRTPQCQDSLGPNTATASARIAAQHSGARQTGRRRKQAGGAGQAAGAKQRASAGRCSAAKQRASAGRCSAALTASRRAQPQTARRATQPRAPCRRPGQGAR